MYSLLCCGKKKYVIQLTSELIHKTRKTVIIAQGDEEYFASIISTGSEKKLQQQFNKLCPLGELVDLLPSKKNPLAHTISGNPRSRIAVTDLIDHVTTKTLFSAMSQSLENVIASSTPGPEASPIESTVIQKLQSPSGEDKTSPTLPATNRNQQSTGYSSISLSTSETQPQSLINTCVNRPEASISTISDGKDTKSAQLSIKNGEPSILDEEEYQSRESDAILQTDLRYSCMTGPGASPVESPVLLSQSFRAKENRSPTLPVTNLDQQGTLSSSISSPSNETCPQSRINTCADVPGAFIPRTLDDESSTNAQLSRKSSEPSIPDEKERQGEELGTILQTESRYPGITGPGVSPVESTVMQKSESSGGEDERSPTSLTTNLDQQSTLSSTISTSRSVTIDQSHDLSHSGITGISVAPVVSTIQTSESSGAEDEKSPTTLATNQSTLSPTISTSRSVTIDQSLVNSDPDSSEISMLTIPNAIDTIKPQSSGESGETSISGKEEYQGAESGTLVQTGASHSAISGPEVAAVEFRVPPKSASAFLLTVRNDNPSIEPQGPGVGDESLIAGEQQQLCEESGSFIQTVEINAEITSNNSLERKIHAESQEIQVDTHHELYSLSELNECTEFDDLLDHPSEERHALGENHLRHSLQEIIDFELAVVDQNDSKVTNPARSLRDIMDSLDDPELNESLEDQQLRDESFVPSSSLENSFNVDSPLFPEAYVIKLPFNNDKGLYLDADLNRDRIPSTPTKDCQFQNDESIIEPEGNEAPEVDEADSTWNMNRESEEGPDIADESSFNTTAELDIPTVVEKMDDGNLYAKTNKNKTKQNFCFYCKKMQSVISRHLETVHKHESPVKVFAALPKGNPERKKIIERLRLRGNYLYNTDETYNKSGELLVARRPQTERSATLYQTCHNCKGVFSIKTIRRHRQSCVGASSKGERSNVILSRRIEGRLHNTANERLVRIMAVLRENEILRLIRYDELLIKFGNCMCEKYYKQQQEEMIRNRLRTLGRLLKLMKEADPDISDFKSIYHPTRYRTMVKAVRKLSGFDPLTGVHNTPSLVSSVGTYVKAVGQLLKLYWVEKVNEEQEKLVDKYIFLHDMQYGQVINRVAREDQSEKHRQKVKPLPSTGDIKKLTNYLHMNMESAYATLNEKYSYQAWLRLLEFTLSAIQIFNRRRAGEIERSLIADLTALEKISKNNQPEIYEKLSSTQKCMAEEFSRFVIRGKLGRDVPVLLNSLMEKSLKLILMYRSSTKIPAKNPYIFGIPGFTDGRFKYLRACQLLRRFSEECDVEHPERLRGTYLRKHVATTCAEANMDENKITDITNFMGHAEAIHRSHYRRSVVSRDVLGVASILCRAQGDDVHLENQSSHSSASTSASTSQQKQTDELIRTNVWRTNVNSSEHVQCSPTPCSSTRGPPISRSRSPISPRHTSESDKNRAKKRKRVIYSSSNETDADIPSSAIQLKKKYSKKTNSKRIGSNTEKMKKIRWTDEEKLAAFGAFARFIDSNRLPGTADIKKFLADNPWFTRTVSQIRTWASNERKKSNINRRD